MLTSTFWQKAIPLTLGACLEQTRRLGEFMCAYAIVAVLAPSCRPDDDEFLKEFLPLPPKCRPNRSHQNRFKTTVSDYVRSLILQEKASLSLG